MDALTVIAKLGLTPLPEEGGYYRETFRDPLILEETTLPSHSGPRAASTCIYYLVTPEEFSALHAVRSTEIFHFYAGDPVKMVEITQQGFIRETIIGSNLAEGQLPQHVVAKDIWQGTKLVAGGKWALLGCTVAPGFDFSDFQGGTCAELTIRFPQHADLIREYTHS